MITKLVRNASIAYNGQQMAISVCFVNVQYGWIFCPFTNVVVEKGVTCFVFILGGHIYIPLWPLLKVMPDNCGEIIFP